MHTIKASEFKAKCLAQAGRGEFATDEEVKAFFARHGKPGA